MENQTLNDFNRVTNESTTMQKKNRLLHNSTETPRRTWLGLIVTRTNSPRETLVAAIGPVVSASVPNNGPPNSLLSHYLAQSLTNRTDLVMGPRSENDPNTEKDSVGLFLGLVLAPWSSIHKSVGRYLVPSATLRTRHCFSSISSLQGQVILLCT